MNEEKKRQQLVNDCYKERMDDIWRKLQSQVKREHQNYIDPVFQEHARRENLVIYAHRGGY